MTTIEPLFTVNALPVYSTLQEGFDEATIPHAIAYVIDASGWKLCRRNALTKSIISVKSIDGAKQLTESCLTLFGDHKIPQQLIKQVVAFFTAVYKRDKTEAAGYLYYNPSASPSWEFIVPDQTATSAACSYEGAPRREGWLLAGTIHSHGSMSAFHSGTDHADEKHFDGVHITVGKVDESSPEFAYSIMTQGTRFKCDAALLIESYSDGIDVPKQWLEAVKERPASTTTYPATIYGQNGYLLNDPTPLNTDIPPSGTNGTTTKLTKGERRKALAKHAYKEAKRKDVNGNITSRSPMSFLDPRRYILDDWD